MELEDAGVDRWYFAYGSNLDPERKECRTGEIREFRRCHALGYRFAFNKRAVDGSVYANIVAAPGDEVWGVVYRCSPEALARMDRCEGVPNGHYVQHQLTVMTDDGERLTAIAYIAGSQFVAASGRPDPDYLRHILHGARTHNLPPAYIHFVEKCARGHDP